MLFRITALSLLLVACASPKPKSSLPSVTYRDSLTMPAPVSAPAQTCQGCIVGSSSINEEGKVTSRSHFLYGAEHLNLQNYYYDIPVLYNADVKKWIDYFINKGRPFFIRYSERAGKYAPLMAQILKENGLPQDLIFLAMAESGFQNEAKSWARAVGPWQFMWFTGKKYGLKTRDWYVDERRDPIKSTIAAARYLKDLYVRFGSWELAAAAYNAGEGKIDRAIQRYKTENFWEIKDGRYLKRETKNYVPKIMALAILGKNLASFGFKDIDFHEPLDFEEVVVPGNSDLVELADAIKVDFDELKRLNPELLRWMTPPGEDYHLRIPVSARPMWSSCCDARSFPATKFQRYEARRGDTLAKIAKKFRIADVGVMSRLNENYRPKERLPAGEEIRLPFREGQNIRADMYSDLYEKPLKKRWKRRYALRKRAEG